MAMAGSQSWFQLLAKIQAKLKNQNRGSTCCRLLYHFTLIVAPINSAPRFITVHSCWAETRSGLASAPSAPTLHLDKPGPPGKSQVVVCQGPLFSCHGDPQSHEVAAVTELMWIQSPVGRGRAIPAAGLGHGSWLLCVPSSAFNTQILQTLSSCFLTSFSSY